MKVLANTIEKMSTNNPPLDTHGGDRWAAQAKWGIKADQFLDFSANINPLGPSPYAWQAIKDNLQLLEYYPEPSAGVLKRALAEYLGVNAEQIVLGNGSMELIYLCTRLFGDKRIIVLAPAFSEYGQGEENPRIIQVALDLGHMNLPLKEIAGILESGDLLFIANPNNPTGNLFHREELLQLVELVKDRQAILVMDEAFIDFVGQPGASLRDIGNQDNLIILGSLTKFFALPGLRIGYALSSTKNLQSMERLLPRWRINSLALVAGGAALLDREYITRTKSLIAEQRAYMTTQLSNFDGFAVYPSQANFILVDASGRGVTARELQARLGPKGILIRDCSSFSFLSPYHFRLAVRNHQENQFLLNTMREVLG